MRLSRFKTAETVAWGVVENGTIHSLTGTRYEPTLERISSAGYRRSLEKKVRESNLQTYDTEDVSLLAPVPQPPKIVCVGMNYHDHAEEQDEEVPEKPLLFGKAPTTVTNPGDPIVHPAALEEVDYEVELGVVIGSTTRSATRKEAKQAVAGYTVINDVSGRDAQFDDGQFFRGKSYDTFSPMGPVLATPEEIDPNDVSLSCKVNGVEKQSSSTSNFIFDVFELISYISDAMTLVPGDVISTGTPGGVGIFREPRELLEPGDEVSVAVEGIGELCNPVTEEQH
ncbi:fumarylacetoacetate hydrolase family protein [Haloferax gibbonsii]|uniref:5-carboxymethyl-2-hydroxymuconate isomerase n=1 Tax=Haloferax gibbonsii TaxID=35746 RepID=A0A0K1IZ79_HALGI|nr:fumarylacetoacetate hydrolase family protein [Haloferax gibbonsii]AKU09827.1 5-carboxymethyl-2-hydroxymuconate isomerase [Haloferax gibbonsii]